MTKLDWYYTENLFSHFLYTTGRVTGLFGLYFLSENWDWFCFLPNSGSVNIELYLTQKFLGVYPWEMCSHKTHTRMFPAASFVTCERWKQHKCASVGEWINETVYPYNRILLSNENKWGTDAFYSTGEPWKHWAKYEKPATKTTTYDMIPFI